MIIDPAPRQPGSDDVRKARSVVLVIVIGVFAMFVAKCASRTHGNTAVPASSTYRAAAEELVRQRLRDPSSAEFSEIRVIDLPGKPTIVCGRVNARNGFGGMTGSKRFVVGATVAVEGDVNSADIAQLWATFC